MKTKNTIKNMTMAAVCIALCVVLPIAFHSVPDAGSVFLPMHIPVLLCGLICGWPWGAAVGFIAPLLRYALFGMPQIFPMGISMAAELAVYGMTVGMVYARSPKNLGSIYVSLGVAMIAGRIVWGAVRYLMAVMTGVEFTMDLFLAGAFFTAWPGIILQFLLIPPIVRALERSKLAMA